MEAFSDTIVFYIKNDDDTSFLHIENMLSQPDWRRWKLG